MGYFNYFNDSFTLVRYILVQIYNDYLSMNIRYFLYFLGLCVLFLLANFIILKIRSVKEFLDDFVCVEVEIPPLGDIYQITSEVIKKYNIAVSQFGSKYFASLEMFISKNGVKVLFSVPRKIYSKLDLGKNTEIVNDVRQDLIEKISRNSIVTYLEFAKDFVYPMKFGSERILNFLGLDEYIFIQLLLRPANKKWLKNLYDYIETLKQGKNPSVILNGCLGSFLKITLSFFSLLGDILTSFFHGSSSTNIETKKDEGLNISNSEIEKIKSIESKKCNVAFESCLKVVLYSEDNDRKYGLVDKIVQNLSFECENFNHYCVAKFYNSMNNKVRNDLLFGYMPKDSVDILCKKEILELVKVFS